MKLPKVLIAAPTSSRHSHLMDEWLSHLDKLTYPNFEVCLVDTTPDKGEYLKFLKKKKLSKPIKFLRHPWNYKKEHILQLLADAREIIRKYFLKGDFDTLLFLDDDIFIPKNSLQKLLSRNKDCVGFYVHIYDKLHRKPCVLKSGEIFLTSKGSSNLFTFAEINAYKRFVKKFKEKTLSKEEKYLVDYIIKDKIKPELVKVYAIGIGCLMIQRKVLEKVPFRTHPTFILGEDIWFFAECNDKGFEFWLDSTVRAKHKNTNWNLITQKRSASLPRMYLAIGPANARKVAFINQNGKNNNRNPN